MTKYKLTPEHEVPDIAIKIKRQRERTPEGWKRIED